MKRLIFVLGTGRSGTHLMGRTIGSHPLVEDHIEDPDYFYLAVRIATIQDIGNPFYLYVQKKRLIRKYRSLVKKSSSNFILEKTHPNIWLAEELMKQFPNALFVGIIRDAYQTVSSMLKHSGVMSWYSQLPQHKPNRFLGITEENKSFFASLPIEAKCTYRWISHKQELERLKEVLGNRYVMMHYDEFVKNPQEHICRLSEFLGIDKGFQPEAIKLESLQKWKKYLSDDQLAIIDSTIEGTISESQTTRIYGHPHQ